MIIIISTIIAIYLDEVKYDHHERKNEFGNWG